MDRLTTYQEIREIYKDEGHMLFILAFSILQQHGTAKVKELRQTESYSRVDFGNLISEEGKEKAIVAAIKMADAPLDVLLAVIQREVVLFEDPQGERIPYLHSFGDQEGICPLCGGELEYEGDQEIVDNGTLTSWTCTNCGSTGKEGADIVFERHYNICSPDGRKIRD